MLLNSITTTKGRVTKTKTMKQELINKEKYVTCRHLSESTRKNGKATDTMICTHVSNTQQDSLGCNKMKISNK